MFIQPIKKNNLYNTLLEFAYAEYGSALEMLAASKKVDSPRLKVGYINHALDEYRHSKLIFEVLNNEVLRNNDFFKKDFKFTPQNVISKGYVDKRNFLVEKLKLKNFVEFVYTNEYLAKDSFESLIKRIKDSDSLKILKRIASEEDDHADYSADTLNTIMKEEDRHWGFAKLFYDKKFPNSNLQIAFKKEKFKNKLRMFYFKNVFFLNKIFDPIVNTFIVIFGLIPLLLRSNSSLNKNLMKINKTSII
jgi:rubrerythrin|tara:strand:+ start:170 stop:913 length:744 start_codon:yes stop_codon:yes gene_type:complete